PIHAVVRVAYRDMRPRERPHGVTGLTVGRWVARRSLVGDGHDGTKVLRKRLTRWSLLIDRRREPEEEGVPIEMIRILDLCRGSGRQSSICATPDDGGDDDERQEANALHRHLPVGARANPQLDGGLDGCGGLR